MLGECGDALVMAPKVDAKGGAPHSAGMAMAVLPWPAVFAGRASLIASDSAGAQGDSSSCQAEGGHRPVIVERAGLAPLYRHEMINSCYCLHALSLLSLCATHSLFEQVPLDGRDFRGSVLVAFDPAARVSTGRICRASRGRTPGMPHERSVA